MKSLLTTFKVLIVLFWLGLFTVFAGFVFFGDQIIAFLYSIPVLVQIKDYLGLTRDSLESFAIFVLMIMIPFTIIVFLVSSRYTKRIAGKTKKPKKIVTGPPPTRESLKQAAKTRPLKAKKERKKLNLPSIKLPKINFSKFKKAKSSEKAVETKTKTIGLTGLQIK